MTRLDLWESARGLVIEQFRSSPNLLAVLKSAVGALQDAEDSAERMSDAFDISAATGGWLDLIGKIRNVSRKPGETDAEYRARMEYLFKDDTAGTPDNVISNVSDLSGDPSPSYTDECPATFLVYTPGGRQLLRSQVRRLAPAGVLGLPGAAISAADGTLLATAEGSLLLAVARDADREA